MLGLTYANDPEALETVLLPLYEPSSWQEGVGPVVDKLAATHLSFLEHAMMQPSRVVALSEPMTSPVAGLPVQSMKNFLLFCT